MTNRDRMVIVAVAVVLVLVVGWFALVAPERQQAASLQSQVSTASAALATADSQAASARSAQAQYQAAYASIVSLGKAVPPSEEVSSLMYQLAQDSRQKSVTFAAITSGLGGSSSSATPSATVTGFTPMPFTFAFNGTFADLYDLFRQLDRATVVSTSGRIVVSGRLLTIQSVKLSPLARSTPGATGSGAKAGPEELTGTITATAYVLPAGQGLTAGATASAPTGRTLTSSSASAASSAVGAGSPTPPAVARVTP